MKKILFIFALSLVAIMSKAQTSPRGDLNNDGIISISDVMELVNIVLYGDAPQAYTTCPDENHPHMIDLGLPSGTKWACCNVGADKPTAYGCYYAWGETEEKSIYDTSTYIHNDDSSEDLGEDIAGTEYDVAHVKWGGSWVMPSEDHLSELENNCTYKWTTVDGVKGGKFTGKNGGSIFLPAVGRRDESGLNDAGSVGYYWLSIQPSWGAPILSSILYCESGEMGSGIGYCSDGQSVRPIADNNTINSGGDLNNDGIVTISDVMELVQIVLYGDATQFCPDDHHPHLIDLGLPSGTKWACCNVGANKPEAYGGYYAWGETEEKSIYNWSTYKHCDGTEETCHDLGSDIAGTKYDVAHVKWGGYWVMPSTEQHNELIENCNHEWTTVNGVNGEKFTSKINNVSIFLPAVGMRYDSYIDSGLDGSYWSSTQDTVDADFADYLNFYSYSTTVDCNFSSKRYSGMCVRPVAKK